MFRGIDNREEWHSATVIVLGNSCRAALYLLAIACKQVVTSSYLSGRLDIIIAPPTEHSSHRQKQYKQLRDLATLNIISVNNVPCSSCVIEILEKRNVWTANILPENHLLNRANILYIMSHELSPSSETKCGYIENLPTLVKKIQCSFLEQKTKGIAFRLEQLRKLWWWYVLYCPTRYSRAFSLGSWATCVYNTG
jgi:hypothetical protein